MRRTVDTGTEQLLCHVEDHVATVSFNRPERRNALGDIVTPALRAILLVLEADADVRVVVLTGVGKAFCAGGDVKGMGQARAVPDQPIDDRIRRPAASPAYADPGPVRCDQADHCRAAGCSGRGRHVHRAGL